MRKLLSVAALLAASTLTLYQPKPAMASTGVVIVVHRHHRHHYRYYYHGRYYWR